MITARFYAKKLSHNVWFCFLPSTFLLASPWKLSLISQFSSSSSLVMITFAEKSVLAARVLTLYQKNSDMFKNWGNVLKECLIFGYVKENWPGMTKNWIIPWYPRCSTSKSQSPGQWKRPEICPPRTENTLRKECEPRFSDRSSQWPVLSPFYNISM